MLLAQQLNHCLRKLEIKHFKKLWSSKYFCLSKIPKSFPQEVCHFFTLNPLTQNQAVWSKDKVSNMEQHAGSKLFVVCFLQTSEVSEHHHMIT